MGTCSTCLLPEGEERLNWKKLLISLKGDALVFFGFKVDINNVSCMLAVIFSLILWKTLFCVFLKIF